MSDAHTRAELRRLASKPALPWRKGVAVPKDVMLSLLDEAESAFQPFDLGDLRQRIANLIAEGGDEDYWEGWREHERKVLELLDGPAA